MSHLNPPQIILYGTHKRHPRTMWTVGPFSDSNEMERVGRLIIEEGEQAASVSGNSDDQYWVDFKPVLDPNKVKVRHI